MLAYGIPSAVEPRCPQLILIADQPVPDAPMDMVDDHYYTLPQVFPAMKDSYEGDGVPVYVGEYACNTEVGYGNLLTAVKSVLSGCLAAVILYYSKNVNFSKIENFSFTY